jgi:hypothetical protein
MQNHSDCVLMLAEGSKVLGDSDGSIWYTWALQQCGAPSNLTGEVSRNGTTCFTVPPEKMIGQGSAWLQNKLPCSRRKARRNPPPRAVCMCLPAMQLPSILPQTMASEPG